MPGMTRSTCMHANSPSPHSSPTSRRPLPQRHIARLVPEIWAAAVGVGQHNPARRQSGGRRGRPSARSCRRRPPSPPLPSLRALAVVGEVSMEADVVNGVRVAGTPVAARRATARAISASRAATSTASGHTPGCLLSCRAVRRAVVQTRDTRGQTRTTGQSRHPHHSPSALADTAALRRRHAISARSIQAMAGALAILTSHANSLAHTTSMGSVPSLFAIEGSAPYVIRALIKCTWPSRDAMCSGVAPLMLAAFTTAPPAISTWIASTWPFHDAKCSGVLPSISATFTAAPPATSAAIASTCLPSDAMCSGVLPQKSTRFTSAPHATSAFTASTWPFSDAAYSGVRQYLPTQFTFAPHRNTATIPATSPTLAAAASNILSTVDISTQSHLRSPTRRREGDRITISPIPHVPTRPTQPCHTPSHQCRPRPPASTSLWPASSQLHYRDSLNPTTPSTRLSDRLLVQSRDQRVAGRYAGSVSRPLALATPRRAPRHGHTPGQADHVPSTTVAHRTASSHTLHHLARAHRACRAALRDTHVTWGRRGAGAAWRCARPRRIAITARIPTHTHPTCGVTLPHTTNPSTRPHPPAPPPPSTPPTTHTHPQFRRPRLPETGQLAHVNMVSQPWGVQAPPSPFPCRGSPTRHFAGRLPPATSAGWVMGVTDDRVGDGVSGHGSCVGCCPLPTNQHFPCRPRVVVCREHGLCPDRGAVQHLVMSHGSQGVGKHG